MAGCIRLEALMLDVLGQLDESGIYHRVLKGSAAAHLDYPDPSLRCFGDVDVLVPSDGFERSVQLLEQAGGARRYPEPRPGFDRRFTKGVAVVTAMNLEVDLHRTLALGPFGLLVELDDLWSSQETFELAGRSVSSLNRERRFLHACYHAALGDRRPRLVALRDVAQAMDPGSTPLDLDDVLGLASRWRGCIVVARAITLAEHTFELSPSPLTEWARLYRPSRRERLALATYVGSHSASAARSLASVLAVPGARAKGSYLRAVLMPQSASGQPNRRTDRVRRGARSLRGGWLRS